jgi:hypothetical protein
MAGNDLRMKMHYGSELEPPIGIEPMTYALRGGFDPSTAVHQVTPPLLGWLLVPAASPSVHGRC